ncbi:Chromosome partition protein Smc [Caulifigura coniformis]|uniref:Chromosome partition protein Smc n=1 Tax=Caulifigura coniformis TaxID=2527983 RepID=A0A517SJM4_9PLAN|nr:chromosome segregation protein SMC [Caulifigura coniformis]QDT56317.1 Chromosome partition protein Smc [Caulifigura coniformis]
MLKSLELLGFKSFAERTLFEFAPGITCVVGPNGSGKSNVVDSIKWILGDQSAKSLRGKEMTDVIFNGSSSRKPSQLAEASLTFDNTSGLLPIDAVEVKIGRRLYRSGDSEYLLNGNVVRLKDVRDLLLGTGAGTAAYSIIEQGRVDQILQSNPASRRQVFEEAAGISRFKAKRVDAERRLERVSQNLLRLTDIVGELESQLNTTRNQAGKAAKYRELTSELKVIWTGLAADDVRHMDSQKSGWDEKLETSRTRSEELQEQLARIEAGRQEIDEELSASDHKVRAVEQQMSVLQQAIATATANRANQSQRSEELAVEIGRLQTHQMSLVREESQASQELAEAELRLKTLEQSIQERRGSFERREVLAAEIQRKVGLARKDVREQRIAREAALQKIVTCERQLAALESQQASAGEAIDALERQRAEALVRLGQFEAADEETQENLARAEEALADARAARDGVAAERAKLHGELTRLETQLNHRREHRSVWQARLQVLKEWDASHAGVGTGVREFLARAAESRGAPWNTVKGLVCNLLDVPLEVAPLIDLALGEQSQAVVVEDLQPWIAYWRKPDSVAAGRIAMIGLNLNGDIRRTDPFERTVRELPGVVGRADEVVKESRKAIGLAKRVLGHVWIVRDLDTATQVVETSGGKATCATLQGELLNGDLRLVVGALSAESAVVSRRSELKQLTLDLKRLERAIEGDGRRLAELIEVHVSRDAAVREADEIVGRRLEEVAAARAMCDVRNRDRQRLLAELETTEEQTALAIARQTSVYDQADALEATIDSLRQEASTLEESITVLQADIDSIDQELRELTSELDLQRVELAKQEERLTGLIESHGRFDREQGARIKQREEAAERFEESQAALARAQLAMLSASNECATLILKVETLQSERRILDEVRAQVQSRRKKYLAQEDACRSERHEAVDAMHTAEMQLREFTRLRTALETRMQEEFQLSLEEIVASEVSAYADYLAANHAPEEQPAAEEADETGEDRETADDDEIITNEGAPTFDEVRPELEAEVERLRRRIKALGNVNTESLDDLDELETRYNDLAGQLSDLNEAKAALEDIIRRINVESRRMFLETFESICTHFRELFRKLFGGGEGNIILENPDDVLECGIDIVARPPGKELRSISLLSGGEKTLTAIALLFAMFKSKPSPYCILDEVDAALDDANVERYASIVKDFTYLSQFVIITHRKRTMTAGDVLYGVTMEQAGISKRMSVRFDDVGENGEILAKSRAA